MDQINDETVVNVHGMYGQMGSACTALSKNPEKKRPLAGTGINLRIKLHWILRKFIRRMWTGLDSFGTSESIGGRFRTY